MATPNVLALTGYGINCDEETSYAFEQAGAQPEIVHINDLIDSRRQLEEYQILVFPGGFSYGDHTGSGNALAHRIRNHLWEELLAFVERDTLALGICNGFQVMVNVGLLPATNAYGDQEVALIHNDSARYLDRWVDLQFSGDNPWVKGLGTLPMPIAHGEGKFYAPHSTLETLHERDLVFARYTAGDMCDHLGLPANPNGSLDGIAGITDTSGRLIGMMPHPERAIQFTQLPNWTFLKEQCKREGKPLPTEGPCMQLFRNAVQYFE